MSSVQYTVNVAFCLLCLSSLRIVESRYNSEPKYSIENKDLTIKYDGLLEFERNLVKERNVRDIGPTPQSTDIVTDNHNYYNSSYFTNGADFYIDLETEEPHFTTITHAGLSSAHLKAAPIQLPFTFPFYGHNITTAYIATGGFLYVGSFVHEFLTVTQYIAPLMGNFDSSINDTLSIIRYANNGTAFTVEWKNNHINHMEDAGGFTFQTTLMSDGRIIFAYKKIPVPVDNIRGGNGHSVTVGLSDGYYIDEPLYEGTTLYKRTIYTYHIVSMDTDKVKDNAAFIFYPLRTCNQLLTCDTCTKEAATINFDCSWCSDIDRCSSGIDRHREEWVENKCDLSAVYSDCPQPFSQTDPIQPVSIAPGKESGGQTDPIQPVSIAPRKESGGQTDPIQPVSIAPRKESGDVLGLIVGLVVIILVTALLVAAAFWVVYACRNPTSLSGLFLIEAQSFAKGKLSKDTSNEDRYIVNNSTEESETKTDMKSANGHSTSVVNTTQSTSEA